MFGERLDTILRHRIKKISGFTRPHVIGFVADLFFPLWPRPHVIGFVADIFFSTLESGFIFFRIRCRIRRIRVDDSPIRKKKLRIRKYPDTCGRGLTTRIRIFLNPQLFLSGYGYRPHVSGEFDSESGNTLSKVEKNISATNPITCGRVNPDIFLSDDVKRVSRHNVEGEQGKFPATISLYGTCSEDILVQRSLGYQSESGYVWTGKFLYPERKSCGFKNIRIRVDGA